MVKLEGLVEREIPVAAADVWRDAGALQWLNGWDDILVTEPPAPGGQFLLVEDRHRVACTWTRVEPGRQLDWIGDDGSSGSLTLSEAVRDGAPVTTVCYAAQMVPHAASERMLAGAFKAIAAGKTRRETERDLSDELASLARRAHSRAQGSPVDDQAPRYLLAMCQYGAPTLDPDTVPVFSDDGRLNLAAGETVLWSASALPAAEAASAASGREQWQTLWSSPEPAELTLTDRRLVWDIRRFVKGDGSWLVVGGLTGTALVGWSLGRARAARAGRTMAGQVMHHQLLNLVTGAGSRPTFSGPATVTATLLEAPSRVLRVSVAVQAGPDAAAELARRWTRAAAADRLQRFSDAGSDADDATLRRQVEEPTTVSNFHGEFWALPKACALGQDRPMG